MQCCTNVSTNMNACAGVSTDVNIQIPDPRSQIRKCKDERLRSGCNGTKDSIELYAVQVQSNQSNQLYDDNRELGTGYIDI